MAPGGADGSCHPVHLRALGLHQPSQARRQQLAGHAAAVVLVAGLHQREVQLGGGLRAPVLAAGHQPLAALHVRRQAPVASHQLPQELGGLHTVLLLHPRGLQQPQRAGASGVQGRGHGGPGSPHIHC